MLVPLGILRYDIDPGRRPGGFELRGQGFPLGVTTRGLCFLD